MKLTMKRRLLAVAALAALAVVTIIPAAAVDTVVLTNGAGCISSDGAYGEAWRYADFESSYDHVKTFGGASGCELRKVDSAAFYYGGSWHYHGPSGFNNYDTTYYVLNQWSSGADGAHRICGVGPVCGSTGYTSD